MDQLERRRIHLLGAPEKIGFLLTQWELLGDMLSAVWLQLGLLPLLRCDGEASTQRKMYAR